MSYLRYLIPGTWYHQVVWSGIPNSKYLYRDSEIVVMTDTSKMIWLAIYRTDDGKGQVAVNEKVSFVFLIVRTVFYPCSQ